MYTVVLGCYSNKRSTSIVIYHHVMYVFFVKLYGTRWFSQVKLFP